VNSQDWHSRFHVTEFHEKKIERNTTCSRLKLVGWQCTSTTTDTMNLRNWQSTVLLHFVGYTLQDYYSTRVAAWVETSSRVDCRLSDWGRPSRRPGELMHTQAADKLAGAGALITSRRVWIAPALRTSATSTTPTLIPNNPASSSHRNFLFLDNFQKGCETRVRATSRKVDTSHFTLFETSSCWAHSCLLVGLFSSGGHEVRHLVCKPKATNTKHVSETSWCPAAC
jgi:hypothetical protein